MTSNLSRDGKDHSDDVDNIFARTVEVRLPNAVGPAVEYKLHCPRRVVVYEYTMMVVKYDISEGWHLLKQWQSK